MSQAFQFRFEDNGRVFCEGQNDVLEFYKEEPLRTDTRLQVCFKISCSNFADMIGHIVSFLHDLLSMNGE